MLEELRDRSWHTLSSDDVRAELETGPDGLTRAEARERLERFGPNEIEHERPTPWWKLLLHQVLDPLIYILLGAAVVTLFMRDYVDMGVILAVVILNTVIGFIQEYRAQQAMGALAKLSAPHAEVVRDGHAAEIESRDLVPGDLVLLASGTRVPADMRLVEVRDLAADESALTGESLAVGKRVEPLESERMVPGDQLNMTFAGTIVTRGRGRGIVVRTGAQTEIGRIATTVRELGVVTTPLQERFHWLATRIALAVIALSILVAGLGLALGLPGGEILLTAVALAVATIPEGLPVVLTVTLAIGVRRMARRKAIIRSLPAVETLGSTSVIGSDKTGTLTKNEMTVRAVWTAGTRHSVSGAGYEAEGEITVEGESGSSQGSALERTLLAGALANEAEPGEGEHEARGDPTEIALHVVARKGGVDPSEARRRLRQLDILPFESERRFMATLNEEEGARTIFVKGAVERILEMCDARLGDEGGEPLDRDSVRECAEVLAAEGLRVLAMAERRHDAERIDDEALSGGFSFSGLVGMEDPVRPEAVEAVRAAHGAGIRVLMLTGDHLATARAIGRQLGIAEEDATALEGRKLEEMDGDELDEVVRTVNIYARVAPDHKLRIVQQLKQQGEIVAVTGDGVNDAPALRAAHLGIAMGRTGTDVAREASKMVLADDNFATITAAVEEGRVVFANIRKVTFFLLSTGVAMPATIIASMLAGWPLPFIAAQILWINLVTNGLQDVALAFEPAEPGLLRRRPRPQSEGVVTRPILMRLFGVGAVIAAGTLFTFWWVMERTNDVALAQSAAMSQMVIFQFFHVFNCRSLDRSIFSINAFSNRPLFASIVAALGAQLAVLHLGWLQTIFRTTPLPLDLWGMILAVGTLVIVGGEIDKWRNRRSGKPLG